MPLIQRNDEVIRVGTTVGLVAGMSSFVFDGTGGKPDYRFYEPIFFEYKGRQPMIKDVDYTWDYTTGMFALIAGAGTTDTLSDNQYYTVQFQPYKSGTVDPSNIIDYTFFIRKINLPNIDPVPNPRNAPILERLNYFISQYETECLRQILGYALYKVLTTETSSRVNDLLYGKEYTDECGVLQYWRGLVYDPKVSLIANYIYVRFQEDSATQTTGVNTSVNDTDSGKSVSPETKMIDAWNFFSEETKQMVSFLWNMNQQDTSVYPEFPLSQCYKSLSFSRPNNFLGI